MNKNKNKLNNIYVFEPLFLIHYKIHWWDIWYWWDIWCKALGTKAFKDKKRADRVAYIRTGWVLLHITTCCFSIAGNCKTLFF